MKKIFIIAGEASSDMYAAELVKELKSQRSDITFYGLGGNKMAAAGVVLIYNVVGLALVGLVDVIKHIFTFKKIYKNCLAKLNTDRPDLAILIDYPGFNLRIAKDLKKAGVPVAYFISPQVWAWGESRVNLIRSLIDKMIVIFKFEEEFYAGHGIAVKFVGHPLLDIVKTSKDKNALLDEFEFTAEDKIISLLPGSRKGEVLHILAAMIDAAKLIKEKLPSAKFIILKSPTLDINLYENTLDENPLEIKIIEDRNYDCLAISDFALVCSGTATVETAIMNVPMAVIYKVNAPTYWVLRKLIKVPFIGMVNLVAGKCIAPEFIQHEANAKNIAKTVLEIIDSPEKIAEIKKELILVREKLGASGALKRAASEIISLVKP